MFQDSYDAQIAAVKDHTVTAGRVADAAVNASPQIAQGVAAQSQAAPWTDPSTAYALGANGNTPTDPLSQQVATGSLNKKGGGFWHSLGHVVSDAQHYAKLGIRGATLGMDTLGQTTMGVVRDVASATGDIGAGMASGALTGLAVGAASFNPIGVLAGVVGGAAIGGVAGGLAQARGVKITGTPGNPFMQSVGGVALSQAMGAKHLDPKTGQMVGGVDLGTGFMAGGSVKEEQAKNAQAAAAINGHALTPGRMLASSLLAPGSTPYNILSGITDGFNTWELDPARHVLGEAGAARAQAGEFLPDAAKAGPLTKLGRMMGLLDTNAPAADLIKAREFLTTDKGAAAFMEKVGNPEMNSALDIWNSTGRKLPPSLTAELAKSTTAQEAQNIVMNAIQSGELNEKSAVDAGGKIAQTFNNFKANSRLLSYMPGKAIDLVDLDRNSTVRDFKLSTAAEKLDSWAQNAHFDPQLRNNLVSRLLAAPDLQTAKGVVEEATTAHLQAKLTEMGTPADKIKELLGAKVSASGALKDQVMKEIADDRQSFGVKLGLKAPIPMTKANEMVESLDNVVHLPDPREVQKLTNPSDSLRALYGTKAWQSSVTAGDFFMGSLWKPLNLIRPALGVRMVAMESAKMAANGLEAPLTHPLTLIRMALNGDLRPSMATGAMEESLAHGEMFHSTQTGMTGVEPFQRILHPGDADAPKTWAARLTEAHLDPVAQHLAANSADVTADAFWNGSLQQEREAMASRVDAPDVSTRAKADQYVKETVNSHVQQLTASDPTMRQAIADGHLTLDDGTQVHFTPLAARREEVEAAANKAADQAAERATRAGVKRSEAPAPTGPAAEKLTDMEKATMRGANKAARDVVEEEYPTLARTTSAPAPTFEKPLSTAERNALERKIDGAKANLRAGTGTREQIDALSTQLIEDNAKVSKIMEAKKAGQPVAFAGKARKVADLTDEQEELKAAARSKAYDAAIQEGNAQILRETKGSLLDDKFVSNLRGRIEDPDIKTPLEFKGMKPVEQVDTDYNTKANKTVRWLYSTLISKPMNFLVRSPEFNQLYWQEMSRLTPLLTEDGATTLRASMAASTAQIPQDTRSAIEDGLKSLATNGHGKVEIYDAAELAKAKAVDGLHDMTIDMAHKTGWQDANRLITPFAKHWQQELTQWARIGVQHPDALRAAQMTVQGGEDSGFFYKDDQGAWSFNYPGSEMIGSAIGGVPFAMSGKVSGLSALTSNILPSFGPLVSIPASKILPNKPAFDSIRNFISPYGDPTAKGLVNAIVPPWMKSMGTALQNPQSDKDIGNYTMSVAKYLVSTGKFSMDTDENIQKTLDEAGARAKHMLWLQAFGKAVLPSSPTMTPMAEDKDGRTVVAKLLSKDLLQMRKDDYPNSTKNFIAKYGDNAFLYLQATTKAVNTSISGLDTNQGYDFIRNNRQLAKDLPNTYGFFAPPSDPNSSFNVNAYNDQLQSGQREKMSPLEQTHAANNIVGSMQYYALKDKMGPNPSTEAQTILAAIKTHLMTMYPGFGTSTVGLAERAKLPQVVDELRASTTNKTTKDTPVGQAIGTYFSLRDKVEAIAKARGISFQQSAGAADLRAVLRDAGDMLTKQTPAFGTVYDQVFSREMKDISAEPTLGA